MKRFLQEDPLRLFSGSANYYSFVNGNPIRYRDPLGLRTDGVGFGFSGGILGGSFGGSVNIVVDTYGQIGFSWTGASGGSLGMPNLQLFGGLNYTQTQAPTIDDLNGAGMSIGATGVIPVWGPLAGIGVDIAATVSQDQAGNPYGGLSTTIGGGSVGVSGYGQGTATGAICLFNCRSDAGRPMTGRKN